MRQSVLTLGCVGYVLLLSVPALAAKDAGFYQIGAASVVITPKVEDEAPPVWLAGYEQGRQAEGVHDDIYARAIFIHDGQFGLAIVACDLIGLFHDEVAKVRKEIGRLRLSPSIDYVLVSSTHTHAGPDTLGLWGPVGRTGITPGYLDRVRRACFDAVRQAHRDARRGRLRIGTADVNRPAELIGDLRLPKVIDSQLTVIQATNDTGETIVTLVNMPCHPEVLGSKNKQLSSDFPSAMRQYLETRFGGLAVYNSGAVGGLLSPREPKSDPFTSEPLPEDEIGQMVAYGRIIGRIAESALDEAQPLRGPIRVISREVLIPLWNPFYRLDGAIGVLQRPMLDADGRPAKMQQAATATAAASAPAEGDLYLKTEIGLIQIGALQIAAVPGELYPELAVGKFQQPQEAAADFPNAPLEPAIYPLMTGRFKMVIGLANDEIGYIIPKSQWDWSAPYAYGRKERQYGEINSCGPEAAPRLMAAWQSLIAQR
ncbi:MAG: neutral/alkaline non-lysosomal ceramidase N-terminal domain-containing protein [Phycisphaerae bacterium]